MLKISKPLLIQLGWTRTLPSVAATHANVSRVSRLDNVVQSLHRLLNRCVRVETVALQNIDVVELETLERLLYRIEDMLGRRHYQRPIYRPDEIVYLAAKTILVHVSHLVKLGGWLS